MGITMADFEFLPALPARGATQLSKHQVLFARSISTRAPREGSDWRLRTRKHGSPISTRAPREGSDRSLQSAVQKRWYFYPRSPRGERLQKCTKAFLHIIANLQLPFGYHEFDS